MSKSAKTNSAHRTTEAPDGSRINPAYDGALRDTIEGRYNRKLSNIPRVVFLHVGPSACWQTSDDISIHSKDDGTFATVDGAVAIILFRLSISCHHQNFRSDHREVVYKAVLSSNLSGFYYICGSVPIPFTYYK